MYPLSNSDAINENSVNGVDRLNRQNSVPCKTPISDVKILSVQYFELSDSPALPTLHEAKTDATKGNKKSSIRKKVEFCENTKQNVEVATVLTENKTSYASNDVCLATRNFSTKNNKSKKQKERTGISVAPNRFKGSIRNYKNCTLRRHPAIDSEDPPLLSPPIPLTVDGKPGKFSLKTCTRKNYKIKIYNCYI